MTPWFETDRDRLQAELDAFAAHNIVAAIDTLARARGVLVIDLVYPHQGDLIRLVATYPDFYPYFKPEVAAPDLRLARHQSPIDHHLCLLGRRTSAWFVEDTLADVLAQQMPHLLRLHDTGDPQILVGVEEAQGDPISDFYNHIATGDAYLLIDSAWQVDPSVARGELHLKVRTSSTGAGLQGYVDRITDANGRELCRWTSPPPFSDLKARTVRWQRLAAAPTGDLDRLKAELADDWEWLGNKRSWPTDAHVQPFALLFAEEVQYGRFADGWVGLQINVGKARRGRERHAQVTYMRIARAGESDLAARMPYVTALHNKSVLLVGLGAIGAPVAWEIARAGVGTMVVADHDIVDPATVRRWPAGASAYAKKKVDYLAAHIGGEYPWTALTPLDVKIGTIPDPVNRSANERLLDAIEHADIVVDCTAEMGVNHFLSVQATRWRRPYVIASATPGAWGGAVVRFRPGEACWMCWRHALYGAAPSIALPVADPQGELQPPGCADPTFTGAPFDLGELSLEAVRVVVGELSGGAYPTGERQGAILNLRDAAGLRTLPSWTAVDIARREGCPCNAG